MAKPAPPLPQNPNEGLPDQQAVIRAVSGLFQSHEVQVLGAIGLFIGYICVFFTKVMSFQSMYVGICGVIGTTVLLLLLNPNRDPRSFNWWIRSLAVIVLSLFFTSPQLYFAWTVSVSEAQIAAKTQRDTTVTELEQLNVPSRIRIENSPQPGTK